MAVSVLSSSNENMAEPLLPTVGNRLCWSGRDDEEHYHADVDQKDPGTTRRQQASWSNSSPSSFDLSTTTLPYLFRPKYILAGFMFGALMELAYVQQVVLMAIASSTPAIPHGVVTVVPNTTTTTTTTTFVTKSVVRAETWMDVAIYELSFLYTDVLFLAYLVLLTSFALKKKLTLSIPIATANGIMGMMLGVSVVVALVMGANPVLQQRIWHVVGIIMVLAVALCFLMYAMVVDLQKKILPNHDSCSMVMSAPSCSSSAEATRRVEQETQGDVLDDPRTPSLIEANVV